MKSSAEFLKDERHADGLRSECADCFYTKTRYYTSLEWRRTNPSKVRGYNKKFVAAGIRYEARRRSEDPEWAAMRDRESHRRQFEKDPERFRAQKIQATHRRRALKRINGPHDLTRAQWEAIKTAYGHACAYCSSISDRLTIDHVQPLALGGLHVAWNVVPSCSRCNTVKGARWIVVPDFSRHPYVSSSV